MKLARLAACLTTGVLAAAAAAAAENVALVATQRVEPAPYDLTLPEKVGLLAAAEHRALAFEVSGRLATLAEEGAQRAAGELLVELDTALERAQLRQAELRLREARSELKRSRSLRASKVASEKALESAQIAVELRVSERDAAREQLARRILIAPFDGVVAETMLDPGEVVSPGVPVVVFMDLSELRLELGVPGYQVGQVREGALAFVTLSAFPGQRFEGIVKRVAPAAPEGRHLFKVEIRVPNPEQRLRPGMSALARIVTRSLGSALTVPIEAAVQRNGGRTLFFVEGDRARGVSAADAIAHGHLLVLAVPPPYRELVVRGQRDLSDGLPVRVDNTVLTGAQAQ